MDLEPRGDLPDLDDNEETIYERVVEEEAAESERFAVASAEMQGYWLSQSLTNVLQESSRAYSLPITFRIASYRQIAIGISKQYIRFNTRGSLT